MPRIDVFSRFFCNFLALLVLLLLSQSVIAQGAPWGWTSIPSTSSTGNFTLSWVPIGLGEFQAGAAIVETGPMGTIHYPIEDTQSSFNITGRINGIYQYDLYVCFNVEGIEGGCSYLSDYGPPKSTLTVSIPAPVTPASLYVPSSSTNGSYSVSWSASANATSYNLQRQINGGAWSTVQSSGATSYGVSGASDGTYSYRTQSCVSSTCSGWTATHSVRVLSVAGMPSYISSPAVSTNGAFVVSWGAVAGTVSSYELQEQTNGGDFTTIQNSFVVSRSVGSNGSGAYGYRVRACNSSGCGGWRGTSTTSVLLPPMAPSQLSSPDSNTSGNYLVSWLSVTTSTAYELQSRSNGGSWLTSYSGSSTSYSALNSINGTWEHRVKACNASGCSAWSSVSNTNVQIQILPTINGPENSTSRAYTLTWEPLGKDWVGEIYEEGPMGTVQYGISGTESSLEITGRVNGQYSYSMEARFCWEYADDSGPGGDCAVINSITAGIPSTVVSVENPLQITPQAPPVIISSVTPGSIVHSSSVTPRGELSAAMSMIVPQGINGLQPNLAFTYNDLRSFPENSLPSIIGGGWNITGLNVLRTCRDSNELCLGNQRLAQDSDQNHRVIGDPSVKIVEKQTNGQTWYEMLVGDRKLRFGKTGNSYATNNNKQIWWLSEIEDAFSNILTITYGHGLNFSERLPLRIDYGGNYIEFYYQEASTITPNDVTDLVLNRVGIFVSGAQNAEYRLAYTGDSNQQRLSEIQYCGFDLQGANPQCLPSTQFGWFEPTEPVRDFTIGLNQITNGLGAETNIERQTKSTPGVFDFAAFPTIAPYFLSEDWGIDSTYIEFQLAGIQGDQDDLWYITRVTKSSGTSIPNETEYTYAGLGFGFPDAYSARLSDGTYLYRIYDNNSGYLNDYSNRPNSVVFSARYSGKYGEAGSKRLSETHNHFSQLPLDYDSRHPWYLEKKVEFNINEASGDFIGANIINIQHNWDSGNGLSQQITTTIESGVGVVGGGNVALSDLRKAVTTTTGFEHDVTNWIVGYPNQTQIDVSNVQGSTGTVSIVEQQARWANTLRTETQTSFANSTDLTRTTSAVFDLVGNTTSVAMSGADIQARTASMQNFIDNRYPATITNAESHVTTINEIDLRFGRAKLVTDSNGLQISTMRNNLGQVLQTILANGTVVTSQTAFCNFSCATVDSVTPVFKSTTTSSHPNAVVKGAPDAITYFDLLGRVVRVEQEGFTTGETITVDTVYDDLGRIYKQSLPYISGNPVYTIYSYDIYNRISQIDYADGSSTANTYQQVSDNYVITKTNTIVGGAGTKTQVRVEEYNSLGQLIKSYDAFGTADQVMTEYDYDQLGNNNWVRVNGDDNSIVETVYDLAGNMVSIDDPNTGAVSFDYDALGQVKTQTDARNITTYFDYDRLGRLTRRIDDYNGSNSVVNDYVFDTRKIGALSTRSKPGFTENYFYNNNVQMSSITTEIDLPGHNQTYSSQSNYDSYGRLQTQIYPSGLTTYSNYNAQGYSDDLRQNNQNGNSLSQIDSVDAFGNVTHSTSGNGLVSIRTYDPFTGTLTGINTDNGAIQNHGYDWWSDGTLYQRSQTGAANATETFSYDNLNRLDSAITTYGGSARNLNYDYDALGNLLYKSDSAGGNDIASYNYSADNKPHRLNTIVVNGVSHTYSYDASGNITADDANGTANDRVITYNALGKPIEIIKGDVASPSAKNTFEYGPDGQRFYKENLQGDKTVYLHGGTVEINLPVNGNIQSIEKTNLGAAMHLREVSILNIVTERMEYIHTNHLGSVTAITDENGHVIQRKNFDPFGGYRDEAWSSQASAPSWLDQIVNTSRGFTGHEQLDDVGLIHMNGRVYDPEVGRFLSADPIVQAPTFSQSYNRYAYVWNSPMSSTDPSGYCGSLIKGNSAGRCNEYIFESTYESSAGLASSESSSQFGFDQQRLNDVDFLLSLQWELEEVGQVDGTNGGNVLVTAGGSNIPECGTNLNCVENNDRSITSVGDDVVGNSALDAIAASVFAGIPRRDYEELFLTYTDIWTKYKTTTPVRAGEVGGSFNMNVANLAAVNHTHPYFRGNRRSNRTNQNGGRGDHVNVIRLGVPNYFRAPDRSVRAIERVNNQIVQRIVTGRNAGQVGVWIRPRRVR